jgi:hypothetical protein
MATARPGPRLERSLIDHETISSAITAKAVTAAWPAMRERPVRPPMDFQNWTRGCKSWPLEEVMKESELD